MPPPFTQAGFTLPELPLGGLQDCLFGPQPGGVPALPSGMAPSGGIQLVSVPQAFTETGRARRFFGTISPPGRITFFRSAGRPVLWSGDLAAMKRVKRVARKLPRAARGHHHHRRYSRHA